MLLDMRLNLYLIREKGSMKKNTKLVKPTKNEVTNLSVLREMIFQDGQKMPIENIAALVLMLKRNPYLISLKSSRDIISYGTRLLKNTGWEAIVNPPLILDPEKIKRTKQIKEYFDGKTKELYI